MKGFEEFLIGKKTVTCFEMLGDKIHIHQTIEKIETKKCTHPITTTCPNSTSGNICLYCGANVIDFHFSEGWKVASVDV